MSLHRPENPTPDETRAWLARAWAEGEEWRADPNLTDHDDPRAEHEAEGRKEDAANRWRDDHDGRLADGAAADEWFGRGGAA